MSSSVFPGGARPANEVLETSTPQQWWPRRGESSRLGAFATPALAECAAITGRRDVFTMGSCFARNIEDVLDTIGFAVPTARFQGSGARA